MCSVYRFLALGGMGYRSAAFSSLFQEHVVSLLSRWAMQARWASVCRRSGFCPSSVRHRSHALHSSRLGHDEIYDVATPGTGADTGPGGGSPAPLILNGDCLDVSTNTVFTYIASLGISVAICTYMHYFCWRSACGASMQVWWPSDCNECGWCPSPVRLRISNS